MDISTLHITKPMELGDLQLKYELNLRNYVPLNGELRSKHWKFLEQAIRNETENEMARLRLKSPYSFEEDYNEFSTLLNQMKIELNNASCRNALRCQAIDLIHLVLRAKRLPANTECELALQVNMIHVTERLWNKFNYLVSHITEYEKFGENELRPFFENDSFELPSKSSPFSIELNNSVYKNRNIVETESSENNNIQFIPHSGHWIDRKIPLNDNTLSTQCPMNLSVNNEQIKPTCILNHRPASESARFTEPCRNLEESIDQMALIKEMIFCYNRLAVNVRDYCDQFVSQININKTEIDKFNISIEEWKQQILNNTMRLDNEINRRDKLLNLPRQSVSNDDVQITEQPNTRIGENEEKLCSYHNRVDNQQLQSQTKTLSVTNNIADMNQENFLLQRDNVNIADSNSIHRAPTQAFHPNSNALDFLIPNIRNIFGLHDRQTLNLDESITINRRELLNIAPLIVQYQNAGMLPTAEKHEISNANNEHSLISPVKPLQTQLTFANNNIVQNGSENSRTNAQNNINNCDLPTSVKQTNDLFNSVPIANGANNSQNNIQIHCGNKIKIQHMVLNTVNNNSSLNPIFNNKFCHGDENDFSHSNHRKKLPVYKWKCQFSGTLTRHECKRTSLPLKADAFLRKIQRRMKTEEVNEKEMLEKIPFLLVDLAYEWYQKSSSHIENWYDFVKLFRLKYCDHDFECQLICEMHNTTQGIHQSTIEYVSNMISIKQKFIRNWNDKQFMYMILDNMNVDISANIRLYKPTNLENLIYLIQQID